MAKEEAALSTALQKRQPWAVMFLSFITSAPSSSAHLQPQLFVPWEANDQRMWLQWGASPSPQRSGVKKDARRPIWSLSQLRRRQQAVGAIAVRWFTRGRVVEWKIRKQSSEDDESPETMRKRKRCRWRERTSQEVGRGEDSRRVIVPAHVGRAHRWEPQLPGQGPRATGNHRVVQFPPLWAGLCHCSDSSWGSLVGSSSKSVITGDRWRQSLDLSPVEKDELHILQDACINFLRTMLMMRLNSQDSCLCGGCPPPKGSGWRDSSV